MTQISGNDMWTIPLGLISESFQVYEFVSGWVSECELVNEWVSMWVNEWVSLFSQALGIAYQARGNPWRETSRESPAPAYDVIKILSNIDKLDIEQLNFI